MIQLSAIKECKTLAQGSKGGHPIPMKTGIKPTATGYPDCPDYPSRVWSTSPSHRRLSLLLAQADGSQPQVSGLFNLILSKQHPDCTHDTRSSYETIQTTGAEAIIPPRRGAKIWQHGNSKQARLPRDQALRRIRKVGRSKWKQETGYHRRSLAETAMFRLKTIFDNTLSGRSLTSQQVQSKIRIAALNEMTLLGIPTTIAVPATS